MERRVKKRPAVAGPRRELGDFCESGFWKVMRQKLERALYAGKKHIAVQLNRLQATMRFIVVANRHVGSWLLSPMIDTLNHFAICQHDSLLMGTRKFYNEVS
ncbi:MAG: hypothetical protein HYT12_03955 [Candidatus Liptonbacteria bacterium]|nr:hypothetical protein [Candidatus Liptonbacteria bacterium]